MKETIKIYTYKNEEISKFPEFKERPWMPQVGENVIESSPEEADYIICPVALHKIKSKKPSLRVNSLVYGPEELKYWKDFEQKHVFFDCSDFEVCLGGTKALLFRCNVRDFMLVDKNTVPWFWPVDNLEDYSEIPKGGFKFDVSFHGWLSTDTRKNSAKSCASEFGKTFDYKGYNNFFGYLSEQSTEYSIRRNGFLKSQQESRILLAPESIPGVFPYRFYEAMSSARVPALFGTGYHLPFQDKIDWDKCTIRFEAHTAPNAGKLIKSFLEKTPDDKLIEMGKYGQEMWKQWLNRDKQQLLLTYVLKSLL